MRMVLCWTSHQGLVDKRAAMPGFKEIQDRAISSQITCDCQMAARCRPNCDSTKTRDSEHQEAPPRAVATLQ